MDLIDSLIVQKITLPQYKKLLFSVPVPRVILSGTVFGQLALRWFSCSMSKRGFAFRTLSKLSRQRHDSQERMEACGRASRVIGLESVEFFFTFWKTSSRLTQWVTFNQSGVQCNGNLFGDHRYFRWSLEHSIQALVASDTSH